MAITADRLRELMTYHPETGMFTFHVTRGRAALAGMHVAGTRHTGGYFSLRVDMRRYLAHRLAWLWMTGEWPKAGIDHKDGDPANNRWTNLREATQHQNMRNTELLGLSYDKANRKWQARILDKHIGRYSTREEALAARYAAERAQFGEFVRESKWHKHLPNRN